MKLAVAAAMMLAAAPAFAADPPLQVSYPSDAALDCNGIAGELARADAAITQANQQISNADGAAKGAGLAGTVAVEGMLRTGVLSRAPGLGMFANKAAGIARQGAETKKVQAGDTIRTAETRKAMLGGMWAGKSCAAAPAAAPPASPAS